MATTSCPYCGIVLEQRDLDSHIEERCDGRTAEAQP